jgi:hypothetical protein
MISGIPKSFSCKSAPDSKPLTAYVTIRLLSLDFVPKAFGIVFWILGFHLHVHPAVNTDHLTGNIGR